MKNKRTPKTKEQLDNKAAAVLTLATIGGVWTIATVSKLVVKGVRGIFSV